MTQSTPRIRSLLRQAERVAKSGKRVAAEQLYRQILEEAPETAAAWAGLARVSQDQAEQKAAMARAVELDPQYADGAGASADSAQQTETKAVQADRASGPGGDGMAVETSVPDETGSPGLREQESGRSDHDHYLPHEVVAEEGVLYCANHPGRETNLRCNRCGKPICSDCARPTPVGYRCPECIREQEDVFYSARAVDYVIALVVALPISLFAGYLAARIGFFVIFLSAIAGTLIGRAVFYAVGRRRGRWLPYLVAVAIVIGGALPAIPLLLALLFGQPFGAFGLLWLGIYIVGASGAAYYQLK